MKQQLVTYWEMGDEVCTTKCNGRAKDRSFNLNDRKWGVSGFIICTTRHEPINYFVKHEDGSSAWYAWDELEQHKRNPF